MLVQTRSCQSENVLWTVLRNFVCDDLFSPTFGPTLTCRSKCKSASHDQLGGPAHLVMTRYTIDNLCSSINAYSVLQIFLIFGLFIRRDLEFYLLYLKQMLENNKNLCHAVKFFVYKYVLICQTTLWHAQTFSYQICTTCQINSTLCHTCTVICLWPIHLAQGLIRHLRFNLSYSWRKITFPSNNLLCNRRTHGTIHTWLKLSFS